MLKFVFCNPNLVYQSYSVLENRIFFMDPAIGWFQPEQCGPALCTWREIWNTHNGTDNEQNSKPDSTLSDLIHGNDNSSQMSTDRNLPVKNSDMNHEDTHCNCTKCKVNKETSHSQNRNCDVKRSKGTPWRVQGKKYSLGIDGLHEEIEDFFLYVSPTPAEHLVRLEVVERITKIILSIWPKAKVEVYGSFRTGLYLPTSDIDLVVIEKKDISFRGLEQALLDNNIAKDGSIKVLDKASVPIIKLTDAKTEIKIDISFNMSNGVKSANLIKDFMNTYPVLSRLVLVLKQFLFQRNLNEVFMGGISSYSLILLTISFLQHYKPDEEKVNYGKLLIMFFELYGRQFNYTKTGISIKNGGAYFMKDDFCNLSDGNRPSILCIEDPLLPGNDIGRSSYGALNVKIAFEYAYKVLSEAVRPSSNCVLRNHSILGRIVRIANEDVVYRRWMQETFPCENSDVYSHENLDALPSHLSVANNKDNIKPIINGQVNGTTIQENEPCSSSYSSDCQSSTNSSCVSLESSSSTSSMTSDTDSENGNKQEQESSTCANGSNASSTTDSLQISTTEAHLSNTVIPTKKKSNLHLQSYKTGFELHEDFKSSRNETKNAVNGISVKQRKYSNSQNHNPNTVSTSKQNFENFNGNSGLCFSYSKKRSSNKKEKSSANISNKKDGHVITSR